jgi:hypothetical protein
MAVCKFCGDCPRSSGIGQPNATFSGFAAPIGVGWFEQVECLPARELGQHHVWIPVTHTNQGHFHAGIGTWLYYARGCSDLVWNMGETVLASNRCEAVIMLENRLIGNWSEALHHVSAKLTKLYPSWANAQVWNVARLIKIPSMHIVPQVNNTLGSLRWLLAEAAKGIFGGHSGQHCNVWGLKNGTRCAGACKHRAAVLSAFCGQAFLDAYMVNQLRRLTRANKSVDTIQLHQQPQGGGSVRWLTEIWDVRDLRQDGAFHHDRKQIEPDGSTHFQTYRHLTGRPCMPSTNWSKCFACDGSLLENACRWRDWQPYCDEPAAIARAKRRGYRSAMCGMKRILPVRNTTWRQ